MQRFYTVLYDTALGIPINAATRYALGRSVGRYTSPLPMGQVSYIQNLNPGQDTHADIIIQLTQTGSPQSF